TASDGSLTSSSTASLDLTPANDSPTASNISVSGGEDAAHIAVDFAGTDYDGGLTTIKISTLPAHGQLYADAAHTVLLQPGDSIAVAEFGPTTAYFVPDSNWSGSTAFSFFTIDNEGTQSPSAGTVTLDVAPVADEPTVAFAVDAGVFTVVPDGAQTVVNSTVASE